MAADALLGPLAATTTASATYTGSWVDLLTKPGTPREGMVARVNIISHTAGSAGITVYPQLFWSPDATASYALVQQIGADGSTPFTPGASANPYPQMDLPFILPTGARYVSLEMIFSGTTGTPSVVFHSEFEFAWPS